MPFIIHQRIELHAANPPLCYQQELEMGDRNAHEWRATLLENGTPADLAGAAVSAFFRRADDTMLTISGTVDGSDAVCLLPAGAYAVEGFADGVLRVTKDGALMAVAQLRYRVARHSSDTIVDPDHVIPDISELLAQIERMERGTTAAEAATADANTAAAAAETAAGTANTAAAAANTAAAGADTSASGADAAAARANAAAQQVTDAIIPSFSIGTVQTLPAGSQASATITGDLPKNPVLNLALPKGRDGDAGGGVYGSTIAMSADDPTKVSDAIGAAAAEMTGASASADGAAGRVPKPKAGDQVKYLRGDGTWQDVPAGYELPTASAGVKGGVKVSAANGLYMSGDQLTAPVMRAPGVDEEFGPYDGFRGLVPDPAYTDREKFLRGDGTWQDPVGAIFETRSKQATTSDGIAAGGEGQLTVEADAIDGYTPVGVIGFRLGGTGASWCTMFRVSFENNTATVGIRNTHASKTFSPYCWVNILYLKG